jgi:hypothetical protein
MRQNIAMLQQPNLLEPDEEPFQLESPPNELWSKDRVCREFKFSETTFYRKLHSRQLPRPWTRRHGRPLWAPETLATRLAEHRAQCEAREAKRKNTQA